MLELLSYFVDEHIFSSKMVINGKPTVVNIDKRDSNTAALVEINKTLMGAEQIKIRQSKYLNNIVEQDHRFIKRITLPMLGIKSIHLASETLSGIENCIMLRKGQHVNSTNQSIFEHLYTLAA